MRGFLQGISGLAMFAGVFVFIAVAYGLLMGDTQAEVAPLVGWGVMLLFCGAVVYWSSKDMES